MTKEVVLSNEGQTSMIMATEELALQEMRKSRIGYINLLKLRNPHQDKDMAIYTWGAGQIVINCGGKCGRKEGVFELSSKDITLFKKHPEATSARNLLHCKVARIFESGNRVGVELTFGEEKLVAQVVHQAVTDLQLEPGSDIFAMIKASAFRRVY
jgi:molybdate transport system ATP-binding protein